MTQKLSVGVSISGRTISGGVLSLGSLSMPDNGRSAGDGQEVGPSRPLRDGKPA